MPLSYYETNSSSTNKIVSKDCQKDLKKRWTRIEDRDGTHYDQSFLCHVAFTANDDNIKY